MLELRRVSRLGSFDVMSSPRAAPSLALAAYAETWISGAKVIVLGDALSPLAERLVERGARLVQVYDRDATRVAEANTLNRSRQVSFASLEGAGSAARDGVFDFGIVGRLTESTRTRLATYLMAVTTNDYPAMVRALRSFGSVPPDVDVDEMARRLSQIALVCNSGRPMDD